MKANSFIASIARAVAFVLIESIVLVHCGFASDLSKDPTGIWKWTTPGRNGQPEESTLKLTRTTGGSITGTLSDRAGEHSLNDVSLKGNDLEFTIIRETPNGKVPVGYSLKLGSDKPKITIERPDYAPAAKKAGKKRVTEVEATRQDDTASKSKN
jgi:hypothetical protein